MRPNCEVKGMRLLTVAGLLLLVSAYSGFAATWEKYTAPDKAFSLHYPAGWEVTVQGTAVLAKNPTTHEELQFSPVPGEAGKTPRELLQGVVAALRQAGMPDLTVKEWREGDRPESAVMARFTYTEAKQSFLGDALLAKSDGGATLMSYSSLGAYYDVERASVLLQALAGSLAVGEASVAPGAAIPDIAPIKRDRNARSFLSCLSSRSARRWRHRKRTSSWPS